MALFLLLFSTPSVYAGAPSGGDVFFYDANSCAQLLPTHPVSDLDGTASATALKITVVDGSLPLWFEPHINVAVGVMQLIWGNLLDVEALPAMPMELVVVGNLREFQSMQQVLAPGLERVSGFYSLFTNQAIVHLDSEQIELTRRSAIHELSHLLTMSVVGSAPPWLAEGMAEYFETFYDSSPLVRFGPNYRHQAALAGIDKPSLVALLALSPSAFNRVDAPTNYALAWSLIYFMMGREEGRQALGYGLNEAAANFCKPISMVDLLREYPGGFTALERDWQHWLAQGPYSDPPHLLPKP